MAIGQLGFQFVSALKSAMKSAMKSQTTHCRLLLVGLLVAMFGTAASGAEIILREKATLVGTVVRLGDVADVSAKSAARKRALTAMPLMPTPALGTKQYLRAVQIRDLLVARGVSLEGVTIRGARMVAIGELGKSKPKQSRRYLSLQRREQIAEAVEQAIVQHLREQTDTSAVWNVAPKLDGDQLRRLDQTKLRLVVQGGGKPRAGKQLFRLGTKELDGRTSDASFAVVALVEQAELVVVATGPIDRGEIVRAADVELRAHEGRVPSSVITSLDQAVGMIAARSIRPDSLLYSSHVCAPLQVERGETVTVFARTGGIQVRTFAVAKQDGSMGDLIQVETLNNRKRFDARVVGRGELEVLATGRMVEEYTTLRPRNTRLR